jgi:DNA primase
LAFLLGLTPGKPSLLALCGTVLFVLFGCGMVRRCYRLVRQRDVALELTARGLSWPGMFEKVIPWSEVSEVVRTREFQRRGMAGVHVKIRDYERFKPKWVKNFLGLDTSGVTLERIPLPSTLDVDPKALLQAIQAHRAHFGRGGRPVGSN